MRPFNASKVPRPAIDLDFKKVRYFRHTDLEIGCGVGRFAIDRASKNPHRAVIAIEKTQERFSKFARRIENHPALPNLFPVHGEAASVVTHFIPPESLDAIFLLYPNPYPKLKQRNLRWHNRAFMAFLLDRLRASGTFTIATNVEDYRDEAVQMMTSTWDLDILEDRRLTLTETPRTHFEKKYLLRGDDCWNLIFQKQ